MKYGQPGLGMTRNAAPCKGRSRAYTVLNP